MPRLVSTGLGCALLVNLRNRRLERQALFRRRTEFDRAYRLVRLVIEEKRRFLFVGKPERVNRVLDAIRGRSRGDALELSRVLVDRLDEDRGEKSIYALPHMMKNW